MSNPKENAKMMRLTSAIQAKSKVSTNHRTIRASRNLRSANRAVEFPVESGITRDNAQAAIVKPPVALGAEAMSL